MKHELEALVKIPVVVFPTASRAGKSGHLFSSRVFLIAARAEIKIFEGPAPGHRVIATDAHLPHLFPEFARMAIGTLFEPKPVVDHLMGQGVGNMVERVFLFEQVRRDFDGCGFGAPDAFSPGDKPPRTGPQPFVPVQLREGQLTFKMTMIDLLKEVGQVREVPRS